MKGERRKRKGKKGGGGIRKRLVYEGKESQRRESKVIWLGDVRRREFIFFDHRTSFYSFFDKRFGLWSMKGSWMELEY